MKVILHSVNGYRPELDTLVADWIRRGVTYVGVVGVDAALIEEIIDELCVGDGSCPYSMLTAGHDPTETVEDAIALAEQLSEDFPDPCMVVKF